MKAVGIKPVTAAGLMKSALDRENKLMPTSVPRSTVLADCMTLMTGCRRLPRSWPPGSRMIPTLPNLVATPLPSVVNVTTTRYKDIQILSSKSVMAQVAEPDQSL